VRADIERLRPHADIIIVHAHFGENYRDVTAYQRRIARELIDAGADVVNGHHPHVAQGVDLYRGKPILYSLGNFTFGTPGRFSGGMRGYGWVARYRIDAATRQLTAIDLDLIATDNDRVGFQPRPVGTREAQLAWAGIEIGFNAAVTWHGSTATLAVGR
jgi:poly-gamma-glutamate synthesis protein (capsule biosynthesis protein)